MTLMSGLTSNNSGSGGNSAGLYYDTPGLEEVTDTIKRAGLELENSYESIKSSDSKISLDWEGDIFNEYRRYVTPFLQSLEEIVKTMKAEFGPKFENLTADSEINTNNTKNLFS